MLAATLKLHKEFFTPFTPNQRLFLQLLLEPEWASAQHRPDLAIAFVMDTSGSMRELVASDSGHAMSRLDLVMAAMEAVLNSPNLRDADRIGLVSFDDNARVNVPFLPASRRARLLAAVHRLHQHSGGTHMGAGLSEAMQLLEPETGSKRIILLTDGETMDEDLVQDMGRSLCDLHIPVTAIGVGDFNESVLTAVADETQGRMLDVVADRANPDPPSISAHQLPEAILGEMHEATREVVTDMALTIKTVKGTAVNRVTRVAPQQVEVNLAHTPYTLGNAAFGTASCFIIEFTLPERPANRMRLAQLGITYAVPGANYRGEVPPLDVVVEYTSDEARLRETDSDVMQWVQQRNIEGIVKRAAQEALEDPAAAAKTLRVAQNLTRKLGNGVMTRVLDRALDELDTHQTISLGTAKTMKMGSKTQTLQAKGQEALPPSDEIRRLTGA